MLITTESIRWAVLAIVLATSVSLSVRAADTDAGGDDSSAPSAALPETAKSEVANEWCPVLTDERAEAEFFVIHDGKRVNFCCAKCRRKFEQAPQAYLANLPQFAQMDEPSEQEDEHSHVEEHASAEEHDHAAHEHDEKAGVAKLIAWLGNFHPPSVNFPVALLMSGLIAEVMLMITGRGFFSAAGRFCVWIGGLSGVFAALLGWFFAGLKWTDGDWLLTTHRWVGTAAGVWAIVLLALCIAAYRPGETGARWRARYRLALLIAAMLVGLNGFFGGAMIYGLDHYAW